MGPFPHRLATEANTVEVQRYGFNRRQVRWPFSHAGVGTIISTPLACIVYDFSHLGGGAASETPQFLVERRVRSDTVDDAIRYTTALLPTKSSHRKARAWRRNFIY